MHSTCPETNKCETFLCSTARNLNLADKQTEEKMSLNVMFVCSAVFSSVKGLNPE